MLADVRVVLLQFVIQYVYNFHEFWHLFHVNATPLVAVEDEDEAPEHLLLILNMHQKHGRDIIQSLNIPYLRVIVCICQENVKELILRLLRIPRRVVAVIVGPRRRRGDRIVRECTSHIFLDAVLVFGVLQINQLKIDVFRVTGLGLFYLAEEAPDLATQ